MGKKLLPSRPLKLLRNERWKPYIRYEKETDTWITKAIREEQKEGRRMEETMDKISSKIKVLMEREDLDIIARIVAYMYHDKKDEFIEIASELRKEHIYKDLRLINEWLDIQYKRIKVQDKKNVNINKFDMETINELSE